MVNWEVTVGQYFKCIWIKALKHIQKWKKKSFDSLFHDPPSFLHLAVKTVARRCEQVFIWTQIKTHWSNLFGFRINYVLNVLVENRSQHAAGSELYQELDNHWKWTIPTQLPLPLWFIRLQLTNHQWIHKSMVSGDKWQIFLVSNY